MELSRWELEKEKTMAVDRKITKKTPSKSAPAACSFVCPYEGQEFDKAAGLQTHIEAEHLTKPQPNTIKLTVNGRAHEVTVQPNRTLWYLLRDKLGLTSPKDMCNGYGACGSCTVILNGRPVLSCMTLAIECEGAVIETAEGIADAHHPLIETYTELYAMQCGYCTPGFVVTAKALLDRKPRPTEADIRDALGGNLCKCSSYPAHIRAVLAAAQELWEKQKRS